MLYRLVRPMQRSGSRIPQFVKRIPADLRPRLAGRTLQVPLGDATLPVHISDKADSIRFSLRTAEPGQVKARQAQALAYIETYFDNLRSNKPVKLTHRQAVALSREIYEAWAPYPEAEDVTISEPVFPEPLPADHPEFRASASGTVRPIGFRIVKRHITGEEHAAFARNMHDQIVALRSDDTPEAQARLREMVDPLIDKVLASKGIAAVDADSREMLIDAFVVALRDAFAERARKAAGDYSPDPNAMRFPIWEAPQEQKRPVAGLSQPATSLRSLVEDWWKEAKAAGRKVSTYEGYRNTMGGLADFLKHDDARRVTPEDILRYKDHRLASVNPRTGKPISAKTVKDADLVALKSVFDWAVANRKMASNPAAGITLKVGKRRKLREKGFTDAEATALLKAASNYKPGREHPKLAAAHRWVPWLLAYSGARVGEIVQLRKEDVRQEGEHWVMRITPEAGTVKTNEARDVVIHPHVIEQGFDRFVEDAKPGHMFVEVSKRGDIRASVRTTQNRLREAAREVVQDGNVQPNHGWRHRFKTVGMEAGIDHRILDAIQGHAPKTAGEAYGDVTLKAIAAAIQKLPIYSVPD